MNKFLSAALLAGLFCTSPVLADQFSVSGDTSGAATFNRPVDNLYDAPTDLSEVGTDVPFDAVGFSVSLAGSYSFLSTAGFDNFLGLYSGSFDPTNALANALIYNDDGPDGVGSSAFDFNLSAGTRYFAVVTGYENSDFGRFGLSIDGPGLVTASLAEEVAGAVPEPSSWALMIAGFGLVGSVARRRTRVVAA
jgi:hypothetical protein